MAIVDELFECVSPLCGIKFERVKSQNHFDICVKLTWSIYLLGAGIKLKLKWRWDEQYPEKNCVSMQNMRNNAARFTKELEKNVGSEKAQIETELDTTLNNSNKWTTEMKVNLLKIKERKRNRGRGFMKRMKEAWDDI